MGHKCTVISSLNHHLSKFPHEKEGEYLIEDVPYYLVDTKEYKGNGLSRVLNMLGFGGNLFKSPFKRFAKENKPDVIIASTAHPFHMLAAKYYAKKYKAKLILEVRDIWPLSLQELVGVSKYHPFCVLINLFQKFAYRTCDHCVSLLENAESFFVEEGLAKNSFTCIPNGMELPDENDIVDEALISEVEAQIEKFDFVVGYTGALGVPNNMSPLVEAAGLVQDKNIGVLLVGDGVEKDELKSYCERNGVNNVVFFRKVPKEQVRYIIGLCDAMFINAKHKPIYKHGISPNKIFDYMLENKAVFNGIDAPGNPMAQANCEVRFKGDDANDLAKKLIQFYDNKASFECTSREFVIANHLYSELAKKFDNLFTSLVKK